MKTVVIYGGHDSNITFYNSETKNYKIIEIERITKSRYSTLKDLNVYQIQEILKFCQKIAENHWGFTNDYDVVISMIDGYIPESVYGEIFKSKKYIRYGDHHLSHAAVAFYQSNFQDCLIFSYDGGGNDGYFNIYEVNNNEFKLIEKINCDFGGCYLLLASCLKEVTSNSKSILSLAGKMMGICAYGDVIEEKVDIFARFFMDKNWKKLSTSSGYFLNNLDNPWNNPLTNFIFEGKVGYDFAATSQKAYEEAFLKIFKRIKNDYNPKNVCITGGGALNVLLNERIKNEFDLNVFVPPNPNDCGLSLGASLLFNNEKTKINITYDGVPIIDKENLAQFLINRNYIEFSYDVLSDELVKGKIIGVCINDSEVGPRSLGNRSIICNPNYENMKDILNSKVKFREWYRPFAPFCLESDASKYFESKNFHNLEFMSFAPRVKKKYAKLLPSITHEDFSSRLQIVTSKSHDFFYNLLVSFSKKNKTPILLNTSFNIKGNPILTTYEDAFYVLDNTDMDILVVDNYIIYK